MTLGLILLVEEKSRSKKSHPLGVYSTGTEDLFMYTQKVDPLQKDPVVVDLLQWTLLVSELVNCSPRSFHRLLVNTNDTNFRETSRPARRARRHIILSYKTLRVELYTKVFFLPPRDVSLKKKRYVSIFQ